MSQQPKTNTDVEHLRVKPHASILKMNYQIFFIPYTGKRTVKKEKKLNP
jgi:hypothetical protein